MRSLILIIVFLLSTLSFFGCKDHDTNPLVIADVIYPLTIGNTWIFKVLSYDTLGNQYELMPSQILITGDTVIQGQQCYLGYETYFNRSDGLYCFTGDSGSPFALLYKYPAKVGDSYSEGNRTITVVSVNDTITVPAGTFVCYHYEVLAPYADTEERYLAPKIGLVMVESYHPLSGGRKYKAFSQELTSYTVR